jgi:hypothetical protein
MNRYNITISFIINLFCISSCYSQTKIKPDLYLYFKEDTSKHIYKVFEILKAHNNKEEKVDVFCYNLDERKDGKRLVLAYIPINSQIFNYRDESFLQSSVKKIEQIKDIDALKYGIAEKGFPFKKVYIVEYMSPNKYKVTQVTSYIGSNYYP